MSKTKERTHTFSQTETEELATVWEWAYEAWSNTQQDDEEGELLDRVAEVLTRHGVLV